MNTVAHAEATPAYRVDAAGNIRLNDAGQSLRTQYEAFKTQVEALDRSWCDAVLASLFVRHPWLQSLTMTAGTSWEYDDSGGCYLSGFCRIDTVSFVASITLPEYVLDEGAADHTLAADLLGDTLDDEAPDLALMLLGEDRSEDRVFTFERESLLRQFRLLAATADSEPHPTGHASP